MSVYFQKKLLNKALLVLVCFLFLPGINNADNHEKCKNHVRQMSRIVIQYSEKLQMLKDTNKSFAELDEKSDDLSEEQQVTHSDLKQLKLQLEEKTKALFEAMERRSLKVEEHCEE